MKGSSKVVGIIFLLLALIILIWLLGTQFVSTGQQIRSLPTETNIPDFSESSYVSTDDWRFAVDEASVATSYVAETEPQLQRLVTLSQQAVLSAKQAGADVSQLEARTNTLISSYNELKQAQSELVALNLRVETQKMAPQRSMEEEFTQKTDRIYTLMETVTTTAEQIKNEGLIEQALEATKQKTVTTAPKTIEIPPEKVTSSLPPVLKEEKTEVTTPKTVETSKDREAKKAQREAQREKTTGVLKGLTAWIKGFGETIKNFFGDLFGTKGDKVEETKEGVGGTLTTEKFKKTCTCVGTIITDFTCPIADVDDPVWKASGGRERTNTKDSCGSKYSYPAGSCNTVVDCQETCRTVKNTKIPHAQCFYDKSDYQIDIMGTPPCKALSSNFLYNKAECK